MMFAKKKLPIYILTAVLFLTTLVASCSFAVFADDPAAETEPENTSSIKPMSYLGTQTFFDFAGTEIEVWKNKENSADTNGGVLDAPHIMVINLDTGSVMYEKNPDVLVFPASTVKIMTAIVAIENIPDLDVLITTNKRIVLREGTKILAPGTVLTAREILAGLLIEGSNDCATVLAEYVGGTVENFCAMMNERAKELGAKNTNFVNPTGFDSPEMLTTARDLAIIASHAYYIDEFVQAAGATNKEIGKDKEIFTIYNRNRMIRKKTGVDYFYTGTRGLSVGSTPDGGYCVVAAAQRDGLSYLCVVMKASGEDAAYRDTISLLSTCFNKFSVQKVVKSGVIQCQIEDVSLAANVDVVTLCAAGDISALLPNDIDMKNDITFDSHVWEEAKAPIEQGQLFGELVVKYKNTVPLGTTELVASVSVERSNFLHLMDILKSFFTSTWFITALISAVVLFALYSVLYYKAKKNRRRYRR